MAGDQSDLFRYIGRELERSCHPSAAALAGAIKERHGGAAAAVLFYGSCLRQDPGDEPPEGVQDFYLIVDRCRDAYPGWWPAFANRLLPPNVFYIELVWQGRTVRAKYAVISRDQFRRGTSANAVHPWLWARFAQPAALLYARDPGIRTEMTAAISEAVVTMLTMAAPLVASPVTARNLWLEALSQTYRAELRPESADRTVLIYNADSKRYDEIVPLVLDRASGEPVSMLADSLIETHYSHQQRRRARWLWRLRRLLGKPLTVLRLMKGLFTFDGGVDYVLWKMERHTGVRVPISSFERRHPILTSPKLLWRVYRLSAVR